MKLLLDTHTFIWMDGDPGRLSANATAALCDPANEVWLSVVSVWEMAIKADLGKLTLRQPLDQIVRDQLANGVRIVPVQLAHVLGVVGLPAAHKAPFARLLWPGRRARGWNSLPPIPSLPTTRSGCSGRR